MPIMVEGNGVFGGGTLLALPIVALFVTMNPSLLSHLVNLIVSVGLFAL